MKSWTSSFWMLSLLVTVAVLTTGCGRLRSNGNGEPGSAVATFTAAPAIAAPTEPVEPTAAQPVAPTTAPTEPSATEAPAPTTLAAQSDPSGDALDDLLGGLLNSVADDPTYQGELDQIP